MKPPASTRAASYASICLRNAFVTSASLIKKGRSFPGSLEEPSEKLHRVVASFQTSLSGEL
jgi:hypothetical protein